MKKIHAVSLDFDSCLYHPFYYDAISMGFKHTIVEANRDLLDKILRESEIDQRILCVGSSRQSKDLDEKGLQMNGTSCFPAYKEIAQYLNATFNPMLMADIHQDQILGTSFNRIGKSTAPKDHPTCHTDDTKITVLYAQIHYMSLLYPKREIIFDFFDDLPGVLRALKYYFSEHPDAIPKNVTLRLNHYFQSECPKKPFITIQGTGNLNKEFGDHIRDYLFKYATQEVYPKFQNKFSPLPLESYLQKTNEYQTKILRNRSSLRASSPINIPSIPIAVPYTGAERRAEKAAMRDRAVINTVNPQRWVFIPVSQTVPERSTKSGFFINTQKTILDCEKADVCVPYRRDTP